MSFGSAAKKVIKALRLFLLILPRLLMALMKAPLLQLKRKLLRRRKNLLSARMLSLNLMSLQLRMSWGGAHLRKVWLTRSMRCERRGKGMGLRYTFMLPGARVRLPFS